MLHERRSAGRVEHEAADAVFPAGRAALRTEQLEPAGHEGPGGPQVRGALQGTLGWVDPQRGPPQAALVRH